MVDVLHLYISAAPDLHQERESLSEAVAEIPVTLGWRVIQSPLRGERLDASAVAQADVHLLLLGSDIRAPIGLEWRLARRANRIPAAFLKKKVARTMAALDFIRYIEEQISWHEYNDIADLRLQALKYLADHILNLASYYILRLAELEKLTAWRKTLETGKKELPELHGGIGESSVVLSPERYIPSEGVLIKTKPEAKNKKRSSSR
jgi:hypothetical protein